MRCAILTFALFAPLLIQAAPTSAAEALPRDDFNPEEPVPVNNIQKRGYIPLLPPYPRGYNWRDCVVSETQANHLHRKRDNASEPNAWVAGAPVPVEPVLNTSFPEAQLNYFPPAPAVLIPAGPPDGQSDVNSTGVPTVTARSELQQRSEPRCLVSQAAWFYHLGGIRHSTLGYMVEAGRNVAFSVAADVLITGIRVYFSRNGDLFPHEFVEGPLIRPSELSAALNWHADFSTLCYFVVTFARGGASGETRLIDTLPVPR